MRLLRPNRKDGVRACFRSCFGRGEFQLDLLSRNGCWHLGFGSGSQLGCGSGSGGGGGSGLFGGQAFLLSGGLFGSLLSSQALLFCYCCCGLFCCGLFCCGLLCCMALLLSSGGLFSS